MSHKYFTRWRCDWCGAVAELDGAATGLSLTAIPRPPEWTFVSIANNPWADICLACRQALHDVKGARALKDAPAGSQGTDAP